ncbi:membrane protein of unknown function [Ruminococcaceae bacterium BL-6]|nr:membrane protein of unknown function [Ruminococcaceae bacterium BL-6]
MEKDKKKDPLPQDRSVDEKLAQAKRRFNGKTYEQLIGEAEQPEKRTAPTPEPPARPQPQPDRRHPAPQPEQPVQPAPAPEITQPAAPPEMPAQPPAPPARNGEIRFSADPPQPKSGPAEKRGLSGFLERRRQKKKRRRDEFEEEEDIYYGLQLKPVDEYKKGYDAPDSEEKKGPTPTFSYLFDGSSESDVEDEIAERFEHLKTSPPMQVLKNEPGKSPRDIYSSSDRTVEFRIPNGKRPKPKLKKQPLPFPKGTELSDLEQAAKAIEAAMPETPKKAAGTADHPKRKKASAKPEASAPGGPAKSREQEPAEGADSPEKPKDSMQHETPAAKKAEPAKQEAPRPADIPQKPKGSANPNPPAGEGPVKQDAAQPADAPENPKASVVREAPAVKKTEPIKREPPTIKKEEPIKKEPPKAEQAPENGPVHKEETPLEKEQKVREKKQKIRELIDASPKYLPQSRNIHVVETDQLTAAFEQAAREFSPPVPESGTKPQPAEEQEPPAEKKKGRKKKGAHSFRFTGETEEDNEPGDEPSSEAQSELDDYSAPGDAPSILHELGAQSHRLTLRLLVTGISTAFLLLWGFLGEKSALLPFLSGIQVDPLAYLIVNLCFLSLSIAFCWVTVSGGIRALASLHANSDSAVAVAAAAVLLQSIVVPFFQGAVMGAQIHVYAVLATGGLFLNTVGKLCMVRRIRSNFIYLISPEPKLGVELFDDYNTALQLAKGCVVGEPVIAYQRKTGFFRNFLRNSYEPDPGELASQTTAPVLFVCSLLLCAASLILTKSFSGAVTAFAAAACIGAPFTNMLSTNLPMSRLCGLARRCGTMLVGYPSVEHFCNTNAVLMDAKDLFPRGTVILNGLKTFGGQRIDEAILDATAMMGMTGGPLSDLFDQIIKNRREILPKAENISYEDERGVAGWVAGRRTLVGNRHLLEQHGIEPPSHDYESKYLLGGKKVVYLASAGELVAMFVISYNSDKRRALELQRMEQNGISLIVRTSDPNVTPDFLAECFGIDSHSVRILPERLGAVYQKLTGETAENADALFVTKGRPTAMMRLLVACVREKSNVTLATALQSVGVILGFVLVAFLVLYSGLRQLTTTALVLYELFWILAVLLIPRLRKP